MHQNRVELDDQVNSEVRIIDIELQAGVNTATIDRVLHGRAGVRKSTVDRVTEAVRWLENSEYPASRYSARRGRSDS